MNIIIIGSGNVATHIAKALYKSSFNIVQIISKHITNAKYLAEIVNAKTYSNNLSDILPADIYIISTPDDKIEQIASAPALKNNFIVHTSGSVEMNVLSKNTDDYGVFYPLQTFKKDKNINFKNVPMCLEASSEKNLDLLRDIAEKISDKIYFVDSEQRKKLHVAAVFVNNFVNHLFSIASEIVEKENLDFEILRPLIQRTFENVMKYNPKEIQTGPAIRNDFATIEKHLEILKKYPDDFAEIYSAVSKSIQSLHSKKSE